MHCMHNVCIASYAQVAQAKEHAAQQQMQGLGGLLRKKGQKAVGAPTATASDYSAVPSSKVSFVPIYIHSKKCIYMQ
jgi:hypothetical protein